MTLSARESLRSECIRVSGQKKVEFELSTTLISAYKYHIDQHTTFDLVLYFIKKLG